MRAREALRCRSQAATSDRMRCVHWIRRSRNWLPSTPISISTMLSQLACFGDVVELEPAQQAARFGRQEGLVKRADGVGGHIVQHGPDALCL